jgi:hypothetical protein
MNYVQRHLHKYITYLQNMISKMSQSLVLQCMKILQYNINNKVND